MNKPFAELKVVELASVLAGPSVGLFFAELGAKVVKVENPQGGDVTRSWKLPTEEKDTTVSAYFSSVNFQKEYLTLHLKEDYEKVLELLKDADVLIVNFKSGDAEKFHLDYPTLKDRFPQLIYASITGFSADTDRVAYDIILQAETGFLSMNGLPGHNPAKLPVAFIDLFAGHQLKEAILIALIQRSKTGKGSKVSCSLEESALASLANQASNFLMEGHVPGPMGTLHPNIAPYGEMFTCKDGKKVVLAIGSDVQFQKLCVLIGRKTIAKDIRFVTNAQRVKNRKALSVELSVGFCNKKSDDILTESKLQNIPIAEIKTMDKVMASSVAKKMIRSEEIDGQLTQRLTSIAFQIDE